MTIIHDVNIENTVEEIAKAILDDIAIGAVPIDVSCFANLHDHVDANEYLLPSTEHFFEDDTDEGRVKANEVAVAVEARVDRWLREGRRGN